AVHLLVPLGAPMPLVEPAETRGVAQNLLVERPQPPRADERLVVEADLHPERRRRLADHVQEVAVERGPGVQVVDLHALFDRRHARAHRGLAVHLDQAVRALAGAAHQSARAVVLERPGEHAHAGVEQRGGDRVALVPLVGPSLPAEGDRAAAVDQFAAALAEAAHWSAPGLATCSTWLRSV